MSQSSVPHSKISIRLSICSEFLSDEKKSIKKAYKSLKGKLGENIMEYSEFKYWFKRFQNNQFDLGYDTSLDETKSEIDNVDKVVLKSGIEIPRKIEMVPKKTNQKFNKCDNVLEWPRKIAPKVVETKNRSEDESTAIITKKDQVKVVERKMKELKLDHQSKNKNETEPKINKVEKVVQQSGIEIPKRIAPKVVEAEEDAPIRFVDKNTEFTDQNLPQNFQKQVNKKKNNLNNVSMSFGDSCCWMDFDDLKARFERKGEAGQWAGWRLRYKGSGEKNKNLNSKPEKFIVDHLWFVLKNPEIQLTTLKIEQYNSKTDFMNLKKFDFILKSMFNSFDNHQIHVTRLSIQCFNADTFYTILKHLKPGTLEEIVFQVYEKGNLAKWIGIVELGQWKLAKTISSPYHTPLTIDNVLHCKSIELACEVVTSEDVVRVRDHFLTSSITECCVLSALDDFMDHIEIENALQSGDLIPNITRSLLMNDVNFCYELPNSTGFLNLTLTGNKISFSKACN